MYAISDYVVVPNFTETKTILSIDNHENIISQYMKSIIDINIQLSLLRKEIVKLENTPASNEADLVKINILKSKYSELEIQKKIAVKKSFHLSGQLSDFEYAANRDTELTCLILQRANTKREISRLYSVSKRLNVPLDANYYYNFNIYINNVLSYSLDELITQEQTIRSTIRDLQKSLKKSKTILPESETTKEAMVSLITIPSYINETLEEQKEESKRKLK